MGTARPLYYIFDGKDHAYCRGRCACQLQRGRRFVPVPCTTYFQSWILKSRTVFAGWEVECKNHDKQSVVHPSKSLLSGPLNHPHQTRGTRGGVVLVEGGRVYGGGANIAAVVTTVPKAFTLCVCCSNRCFVLSGSQKKLACVLASYHRLGHRSPHV